MVDNEQVMMGLEKSKSNTIVGKNQVLSVNPCMYLKLPSLQIFLSCQSFGYYFKFLSFQVSCSSQCCSNSPTNFQTSLTLTHQETNNNHGEVNNKTFLNHLQHSQNTGSISASTHQVDTRHLKLKQELLRS